MSNNLAIFIILSRQRHIPAESSAPSNEGSFSLCWDEQDVNLMVLEEAVEKEEVLVLPVVAFDKIAMSRKHNKIMSKKLQRSFELIQKTFG